MIWTCGMVGKGTKEEKMKEPKKEKQTSEILSNTPKASCFREIEVMEVVNVVGTGQGVRTVHGKTT